MNGPIGDHIAILVFFELESRRADLHVIEEHLLVSCHDTQLILGESLPTCGLLLKHSIIDAERVHLLAESLYGLHLIAGAGHDLHGIAD
jgi:hypothetical protein